MSDEEQEITYQDHEMLEEIEPVKNADFIICEENNIEEPKPKKRHKTLGELRSPRQKFCPRWQLEFPWLRPNRADESIGYCYICRRELVCKKSHLERHQRSFKHMRLQGFENVYTVNKAETELIEAHTSGYLDNDNDNEQDYQFEEIYEDVEDGYTTIKVEATKAPDSSPPVIEKPKPEPKTSNKKRITPKSETVKQSSQRQSNANIKSEYVRDDGNTSKYYYGTPPPPPPPPPKRDSFDLFFESISATVKTLPPKLAAEVKSRISQVIAEFELRAICEQEAQEKAQRQSMVAIPSEVANVIVDSSNSSATPITNQQSVDGTPVTHYVYSYQTKIQE